VVEKGGKFRNAQVLGSYKSKVEKMVPNIPVRVGSGHANSDAGRFKETYRDSDEEPIFSRYTTKIDNHAFRAQYARGRYQELVEQKQEQGREIMRDFRGFDKECLRQVSQDLGHNRLSVVVEHYMR